VNTVQRWIAGLTDRHRRVLCLRPGSAITGSSTGDRVPLEPARHAYGRAVTITYDEALREQFRDNRRGTTAAR